MFLTLKGEERNFAEIWKTLRRTLQARGRPVMLIVTHQKMKLAGHMYSHGGSNIKTQTSKQQCHISFIFRENRCKGANCLARQPRYM